MNVLSRYRGALVGVHCGDSFGAVFEKTFTAGEIAVFLEKYGTSMQPHPNPFWNKPGNTNPYILPAGYPTDDSDQTAVLAKHLIANGDFVPDRFRAELMQNVIAGKSLLWSGQATGAGKNTKRALSEDSAVAAAAIHNDIGTNGSLMRSTPMCLWVANALYDVSNEGVFDSIKKDWAKQLVYEMSAVTHAHPHAKDACWIYTIILSSLLAGNDVDTAITDTVVIDPVLNACELWIRTLSRLRDPDLFPVDPGDWPARGTAEFSLYVALYALRQSESFAHGIELAVKVGGDTDTYAAIAGGLLGAYYGYKGIPEEWRNTILGHDQMVAYADEIYKLRFGN